MAGIDLTGFGFTPTESLVYETLLKYGPGSGYAIARAAGLARANAYSALEGLVTKGAARVEAGRPRRYRPEAPAGLIARISNNHALALERLSSELASLDAPHSEAVVEIESGRGALQLISHDVSRSTQSVELLLPPDAYPLLAPVLRRPIAAGVGLELWSTGPVDLEYAEVEQLSGSYQWPGMPILMVVDQRTAIIGARNGSEVQGHWSSAPAFVAAARLTFERFTSAG
jgi:HTH-type transcriptional regulator, sugar sensing transcriptional regulator